MQWNHHGVWLALALKDNRLAARGLTMSPVAARSELGYPTRPEREVEVCYPTTKRNALPSAKQIGSIGGKGEKMLGHNRTEWAPQAWGRSS